MALSRNDNRPDPDRLLAEATAQEAAAGRGRLKVFFGASPGVGKTYAMLLEAGRLRAAGQDVAIGIVETHGRKETAALLEGLERLPLKTVEYRGHQLTEFDIDGALQRRPAVVLIDELAHSNIAGSRHPKRWQDVQELIGAGIDVLTTVNVQHLESLNNVIGEVTGIRVQETVPDRVVDGADEIILVDLPPDDLLRRLQEGKVYLPETIERASEHFFRKGNLIALRELAVRRMADRMDAQMRRFRGGGAQEPVWHTEDALLACVSHTGGDEKVVRAAARLASRLNARWHAVYVETPALQRLPDERRAAIIKTLKLAQDLGAETAGLSGTDATDVIIEYARTHNLGRIVIGRSPARTIGWFRGKTFGERLAERARDIDIVNVAPSGKTSGTPDRYLHRGGEAESSARDRIGYLSSVGLALAITGAMTPLLDTFDLANIVMIFLLGVVFISSIFGRRPAIAMAVISVACFDFFFVPPRFTFAVSDVVYLVTFAVMLAVGLIIGQLTANLRYQIRVARQREDRIRDTYELARALSSALAQPQVAGVTATAMQSALRARSALLVPDANEKLLLPEITLPDAADVDIAIAQWCFDKCEPAGMGTNTLPGAKQLYVPVKGPLRIRGVLVVEPKNPPLLQVPEQRRLLDTFTALIANALERVHFVEVAQESLLKMESERLRTSLLSALSHDLRTPLTALVGLTENLARVLAVSNSPQADDAAYIRDQGLRMSRLVNNLLDMARLQSGATTLNMQWQSVEELVGGALKALESSLRGRHITLDLSADLPLVMCDGVLIERVFVNLIENALKYVPPDQEIGVRARRESGYVSVEVWDAGPGIPPGQETRLFDLFARGQKESSIPGVGLGLAICKTIIETHHGTIKADNRPEGGARFEFRLPVESQPVLEDSAALD